MSNCFYKCWNCSKDGRILPELSAVNMWITASLQLRQYTVSHCVSSPRKGVLVSFHWCKQLLGHVKNVYIATPAVLGM